MLGTPLVFVSALVCVLPLLLCGPRLAVASHASSPASPDVTLSLLANLHYDVLFGRPGGYGVCNQGQPSMATPGCDSPMGLIRSVMRDVAQWSGSFTLITGGFLRHGSDSLTETEIDNMIRGVVDVIVNSSPTGNLADNVSEKYTTQIALGGTDFIPPNHFLQEGKQYQSTFLINAMETAGLLSPQESKKISTCGYFFRDFSGTKLRVISLNTLLWSNALRPVLGVGEVDPCGQFPFLQNAIEQATQHGRSVIILGDTPPIINVADAIRKESVQDAESYWRDDFRDAYFRIIATYRFSVAAQFFGHTNTFSFVASPEIGPPLYIIPSISPVMGSNPSYIRVVLDSSTGRVTSLTQRYLSENNTWVQGERLEDAINVPLSGINEYLPDELLLITESPKKWEQLEAMRVGGRFLTERGDCGIFCRRIIACASLFYPKNSIDQCASIDLPSQKIGFILAIVFTIFGVLMVIISFGFMILKRKVIFYPPVLEGVGKRRRLFSGHAEEVFN